MGYLLRASLAPDTDIRRIEDRVGHYVSDAAFVSSAGTEFSVRLPKESSALFPRLFEDLDNDGPDLGIINYGIETTTLEEVFMRIVNEDTEALIENHMEANKLLGASGSERDEALKVQKFKDEKRFPLTEEAVKLLLMPGNRAGFSGSIKATIKQISILVWKRKYQFLRSKGQWIMGVFVPLVMIVIGAVIMYNIPTSLLSDEPGLTDTSYSTYFTTPLAGQSAVLSSSWAAAAGVDDVTYVGTNYSDLYDFIATETGKDGNTTGAGIYYSAINNATIMYNATYPVWYPGLIGDVLSVAVDDITGSKLHVNVGCRPMAEQALSEQVRVLSMQLVFVCTELSSSGKSCALLLFCWLLSCWELGSCN